MRKRDNDENKFQNEPEDQNFTSPCWQRSADYGEGWGGGMGVGVSAATVRSGDVEVVDRVQRFPKGPKA